MGNYIKLVPDNFDTEVLKSEKPVLVDFWAEWCGSCRMLAPILDEVAPEIEDKIKIAKLDVDECPDLAQKYEVMSIPTLILFKNGEIISRHVGSMGNDELKQFALQ